MGDPSAALREMMDEVETGALAGKKADVRLLARLAREALARLPVFDAVLLAAEVQALARAAEPEAADG